MDFGLQGKIAMVAAASKGIGLAIAQGLAEEGVQISLCSRNEENLETASSLIESQSEAEVQTYVVDVTNLEDLQWWHEQTCADLGQPDILITNTGGPPAGSILELTDEQWELGIQSTLMNVVRLSRLVQPAMANKKWGRIVHISSLVAKDPNLILPISSTLRTGLRSLTKIQAKEFGPSGITVNSILPGHTRTDRQIHLAEIRSINDGISVAQVLDETAQSIPLRRLAEPKEIANAAVFLCSEAANYISGVSLLVDGALTQSID